jgi:putative ABC transport system ATP-binding protein
MVKLLIFEDPQQPLREIGLHKSRIRIGRSSSCDIQLASSGVSREHALITREDAGYFIEDLDSTNGVQVNNHKTQHSALKHGDRITIHHFVLNFIEEEEPDPALATPAECVVQVEDVSKEYLLGKQTVTALRGVSLAIAKGEFMALAGPSGSGKSTLLNMIGCIDTPSSGRIAIEGRDIAGKSADELADLRLDTLGFVFQTFNLLPVLSAWENVEYPLLQKRDVDKTERHKRIAHYLNVVGLDRYAKHRPNELSGGQRQRVAIARALATHPRIVLADEPTANLDHKTGEDILRLMKKLNLQEGTTFIFSTHDARVMEMADRVIELADGQITE